VARTVRRIEHVVSGERSPGRTVIPRHDTAQAAAARGGEPAPGGRHIRRSSNARGRWARLPDASTRPHAFDAVPAFIRRRADPERYSIDHFIHRVAVPQIRPTDRVLDAGAGHGRYRDALAFARYESTDFEQVFHRSSREKHDFICSLDDIPRPDASYDVVINIQVLEHVEYPQKVIDELFRVLKPGGKLFLTTNQMFWAHHSPYNFYFFTRHGLESLFRHAGFSIVSIAARGGAPWFLAKLCNHLPSYVFYQLAYAESREHGAFSLRVRSYPVAAVLLPLYLVAAYLVCLCIPFLLFHLDGLDRQKDITLGYACQCVKPVRSESPPAP
jgi:2-polyprenyl-3-methyl-5-hydroxy-6-metoxy-1,4-benzoquinol methylase